MLIACLLTTSEPAYIGLAEVNNAKHLGQQQLIAMSNQSHESILATQFLNSSLIAGPQHLISAAQNAYNAHSGNYGLARSLDVEILVYASLQRQISRAIEILGIDDEQLSIGIIVIGTDERTVKSHLSTLIDAIGNEIDPPFYLDSQGINNVAQVFDITETELNLLDFDKSLESRQQALTRCITGRVSLVALDN